MYIYTFIYIYMCVYLWCICNLIEPVLYLGPLPRHRKWLNNQLVYGDPTMSRLRHAYVTPTSTLSKSEPVTSATTLVPKRVYPWCTCMGLLRNWKGCVPWAPLFCTRVKIPSCTYLYIYIYTLCVYIYIYIYMHTYLYYTYIYILCVCTYTSTSTYIHI